MSDPNGTRQLPARHPIIGVWRHADPEEIVEYTISAIDRGVRVAARERLDGEDLEISSVSWNGETLSFGSTLPSTRWALQNALRLLDRDTIDHWFEHRERWVRERALHLAIVAPEDPPIGTWRSVDEDDPIRITVTRTSLGVGVSAIDSGDSEALIISGASWDGDAVRFRSLVPSTNEKREHTLRMNADGSLDHVFAEHAMLVRVR
jgi:hypothetical protein